MVRHLHAGALLPGGDHVRCARGVRRSYGLCTINIKFDASLLFSRSAMGFLSNLGTAPFTLGYNFCFLTYYVGARLPTHPQKQVERAQL